MNCCHEEVPCTRCTLTVAEAIKQAIASERERCARVVEEFTSGPFLMGERLVAQCIIAKIREGKLTPPGEGEVGR